MLKELVNDEHSGFAVTLEVICTLVIITMFVIMTTYILGVMNVQRYMNTAMTSAAAEASRWGGNYTEAYKKNSSHTASISLCTYNQLKNLPFVRDVSVSITPTKITYDSQPITVTISYRYANAFASVGMVGNTNMFDGNKKTISVTVYSVMKSGDLL